MKVKSENELFLKVNYQGEESKSLSKYVSCEMKLCINFHQRDIFHSKKPTALVKVWGLTEQYWNPLCGKTVMKASSQQSGPSSLLEGTFITNFQK